MGDLGFPLYSNVKKLEIDGVDVNGRWIATELGGLRSGPTIRRQSSIIGGVGGRRQHPVYADETSIPLPVHIAGAWNPAEDAPHDDKELGLDLNIEWARANICTVGDGVPVTRRAVITHRDGSQRYGQVQVHLELAAEPDGDYDQSGILFVVLAAGVWTDHLPNDDFADAVEFDIETTTLLTGDTTGFTREPDEQDTSSGDTGSPVATAWWKFTAPTDGDVAIDTNGTPFDTVLGVWTGADLASLVEVTSDDDGGIAPDSSVVFSADMGETYYVQVGGYSGGDEGVVTLNIAWAP